MKSIVLIGMPGSGKTTISKLLAQKLGIDFCDLDSLIEQQERQSIPKIFESEGEAYFRRVEAEIVLKLKTEDMSISTGGGTFENSNSRNYLLENTTVIYLEASVQTIFDRIKNNDHRPLLKNNMNLGRIAELLNIREKHYKLAHYTVLTDNKSPDEICAEVLKCLK